jgi:hypothetical protein
MELLEGVTMRDVLDKENKIAPPRAAFIGAQILSGLVAAHRAGIIHRDIKPANVFLQSTIAMKDIVKIVDFGLAKLVADLTRTMPGVTKNGQILGTLAYMSPEQASGEQADHRADIWAVGATLFHAVSGLRPFDVVELGRGRTTVGTVAPWIDRGLASVIDRALERRPEDRWASAEDMARALAPYANANSAAPNAAMTQNDMMMTANVRSGSVGTAPTELPLGARPSALPAPHVPTNTWASGPPPTEIAYGGRPSVPSYGPPSPRFVPPSYPSHLPPAPSSSPQMQQQYPSNLPPPYAPPPPAMMPYGMQDKSIKGWIIALVAVLALTFLVPIALSILGMFRTQQLVANAQVEGEKRFVEAAKFPTCPAPDRCTEQHEDHGVTYPVCTNKLPKLNPPRLGDYVLVGGSPERVAVVSSPPSGNRYNVTYVMGGMGAPSSGEITGEQVTYRLCRPGRSTSTD